MGREREDGGDDLLGLSIEAAAARVDDDETVARAALEGVAEDGVVSREGIETGLSEASKIVATAETRTELAGIALADAREAAEPVADLDTVAPRLEAFESQVATIESRLADLDADLKDVVARAEGSGSVYAVATGLRDVTDDARAVQRTADECKLDLESFERWLGRPELRARDLDEDVDAIEGELDDLLADLDGLAADPTAPDDGADPGLVWAGASLRRRVLERLTADVRAELDDLRAAARRVDADDGEIADLRERIDGIEAELAAADRRLDEVADPAWAGRFGDRLAAFDDAVGDLDPPIDWGAVRAILEEHRGELGG